jgi:hypothetical protein
MKRKYYAFVPIIGFFILVHWGLHGRDYIKELNITQYYISVILQALSFLALIILLIELL